MDPTGIIIAVLALTFVGVAIGKFKGGKKRGREASEFSAKYSFKFREEDDGIVKTLINFSTLSKKSRKQKIVNISDTRMHHYDVTIFEFNFKTGSGNSRNNHRQTVFLVESHKLNLPNIQLYPETDWKKVTTYFGEEDQDFERYPKFSENFILKGDREKLEFLLSDELTSFFNKFPKRSFEMEGNCIMMYHLNHFQTPKRWQAMVKDIIELTVILEKSDKNQIHF